MKTITTTLEIPLDDPIYEMKDIIICNETKDELQNALSFKKYQKIIFEEWGLGEKLKRPKTLSINFYGPSGTGKTMAAHAVAKELDKKILQVNYAEVESKYVGETSKNLESIFKKARETDAVLLFDEADALLSRRVTDMRSSTDVSVNQTRSVLLTLLDNYDGMVIFTTNFIENFDPAFLRRISQHVKFSLPFKNEREKLWQHYIPSKMSKDIDYEKLAADFDGISAADIANAVLNGAVKAARNGCVSVPQEYFEQSVAGILKSKSANSGDVIVKERFVTEDYVKDQLEFTRQEENK